MDKSELQKLREQIDNLDKIIVNALQQRFKLTNEVAKTKKAGNLPALDEARWQNVLNSNVEMAKQYGLDPELVITIYEAIHKEALQQEDLIINN